MKNVWGRKEPVFFAGLEAKPNPEIMNVILAATIQAMLDANSKKDFYAAVYAALEN